MLKVLLLLKHRPNVPGITGNEGQLRQCGNITLIVPDKESDIAVINIEIEETINFRNDRQNINSSHIGVVAYPRNPEFLSIEGNGSFRNILDKDFPEAPYHNHKRNGKYPTTPLADNFKLVEESTEIKAGGGYYGLPIAYIKDRNPGEGDILRYLKDAESLSKDSKVRSSLCTLIGKILKGKSAEITGDGAKNYIG